jgi:hypothetical protein
VNFQTPILPDGTYKVDVLSSGPTGLQGKFTGGGYLDGLGSGVAGSGDYTTTFAVTAGGAHKDILWLPDTADGPLQPLAAPGNNQVGGGYPLYLDVHHTASVSITDVQVTMNYDPTLLTVSSTSTSINGGTFTVSASAGTAVLHWSGPALPVTSTSMQFPIGFITATVPNSSAAVPIYRAKDLLHLSSPSIDAGSDAVTTSDGLHLVAYVGDGDGNGGYSSADAVLITRVALQTDSGFTAYPLVDPVIVADTDGSGFIPADAPLQVNEAGVGFSTANLPNPPTPSGANVTPIPNNVDPSLSVGVSGNAGLVTAAVNLDDAHPAGSTGLIEARLALTYNPSLFTVSAADVHLGSLLAGNGWSVTPTIDQATGQIALALSSSTPIPSAVGGSLITIDFHPLVVGRVPNPSINLVASVNINGQVIGTELEDAQGTFILTPAPVNGFDPRLDAVISMPAPQVVTALSSAAPEEVSARLAVSGQIDESTLDGPVGQTAEIVASTAPSLTAEEASVSPQANEAGHATLSSVHVATTVIAAAVSPVVLSAAAPLPGIVSQIVGLGVNGTGLAVGQRLADQFFQTLARGTDGVAAPPLLLSPGDNFDSLNWDNVVETTLELASPIRARHRSAVTETPVAQPPADQAALDQLFAQTTDDADLIEMDE